MTTYSRLDKTGGDQLIEFGGELTAVNNRRNEPDKMFTTGSKNEQYGRWVSQRMDVEYEMSPEAVVDRHLHHVSVERDESEIRDAARVALLEAELEAEE